MVMARQQSQVSSVQSTPSRSGTAMTWRSFGLPSLVFGTELPLARHGSKNQPLTRKWCLRWPPMSLSVRLDPFAEPSATTAICAFETFEQRLEFDGYCSLMGSRAGGSSLSTP